MSRTPGLLELAVAVEYLGLPGTLVLCQTFQDEHASMAGGHRRIRQPLHFIVQGFAIVPDEGS
ncbi:MAG TPA: hypothetical protein VMI31_06600, partial [Fimbriimonadaceae bacterium]|nr:hypothetical protein [Fimbriimonadaceae bacterium]